MDHAPRAPCAALVWGGAVSPTRAEPPTEAMTEALRIVPANRAACADLRAVFGTRGTAAICHCQRYKLAPKEAFKSYPAKERARRLREQTNCGQAGATTTSGLVAYLDGEPAGWCAVEPRPAYQGLLRVYRVPWEGRAEDRADESVWAVTCVFARAGFRRRGIGYALARAAVDFARERGARALEAYPMLTQPGEDITWGELHMGTRSIFAAAGFARVANPTPRRVVMRIDIRDGGTA
jgi:GNAT superfamily N-acetyltransferase